MVNINVMLLCTFYWFGNFMVMFLCFSNKFTLTSQAKLTVTSNLINVSDKFWGSKMILLLLIVNDILPNSLSYNQDLFSLLYWHSYSLCVFVNTWLFHSSESKYLYHDPVCSLFKEISCPPNLQELSLLLLNSRWKVDR